MAQQSFEDETARIREVYGQRDRRGRSRLYSWDRLDAAYTAYRQRLAWIKALKAAGFQDLADLQVLDVGCGSGGWLRMLLDWGASANHLHGVDLLPDRIARAKALSPPGMDFRVGNALSLDFSEGSMDLVAASTVFSSVLDPAVRLALAREMARVVRPGGYVMIFDYAVSHPRNPDTTGIGKKEIIRLFPHLKLLHTFKLIFPPPLLRLLPTKLLPLAHLLEVIMPFISTHRLFLLKKQP